MQKILYGYGYRRTYACSFNIGDTTIAPDTLVGLNAVARKAGNSITLYTCTLPTALAFKYQPVAQIVTNRAEATQADLALSISAAKVLD